MDLHKRAKCGIICISGIEKVDWSRISTTIKATVFRNGTEKRGYGAGRDVNKL